MFHFSSGCCIRFPSKTDDFLFVFLPEVSTTHCNDSQGSGAQADSVVSLFEIILMKGELIGGRSHLNHD